jgi:hypothetical protein
MYSDSHNAYTNTSALLAATELTIALQLQRMKASNTITVLIYIPGLPGRQLWHLRLMQPLLLTALWQCCLPVEQLAQP